MSPRGSLRPARRLAAAAAFAVASGFCVGEAAAGAWPRPPGEVFLSVRGDLEGERDGPDLDGSVYAEYGLARRWTLVGQYSTSEERWNPTRAGMAIRYALSGPDAVNRFAVSLGASSPPNVIGVMTSTRLELGAAWGRGFESRWGAGWMTASAKVMLARDIDRPITDLNALVGLRPAEGRMAMLGLGRYADDGGTFWKLSPQVGYEIRDEVWLVPGLSQELGDDRTTSVTVTIWWTF